MTAPAPSPAAGPGAADERRPGPLAWVVIAAGWSLMGWVVAGVLREADRTHPGSWFAWLVGAALVHDLVVLPLALLVGLGLANAVPAGWRGPLRAGLTVVVVIGLATWPTVARYGARADNPTVLPLPAGRNLAVLAAVVIAGSLVAGWIRSRRGRTQP